MPPLDDSAGPAGAARRAAPHGGVAGSAGAAENLVQTMPPQDGENVSGPQRRGSKVTPESIDPLIGTVIAGRYRIDARLGEGGMGAVYRVEHTHMRKRLALKVLHRQMMNQAEIVARFEREAMAAAHIEHPNVAGATDFGKLEDGSCYLVLEYVEGTSLRSLIDNGPMSAPRAIHITEQIFAALKRAHELGIVHRDLKPENVLLVEKDGDADFVKVLDFGIARVPMGSLGGGDGDNGPSLTRAGMVYGTPEYMAPEQALGQDVDGRSDIYGVGVMLFEMLTGRRPYDNKDKVALLGQHVAGPIPSPSARAPHLRIPPAVDAVVTKILQKSPADRYQDAAAAAEALQQALAEPESSLEVRDARDAAFVSDARDARETRDARDARDAREGEPTGDDSVAAPALPGRLVSPAGVARDAAVRIDENDAFPPGPTVPPPTLPADRRRPLPLLLVGLGGAAVALLIALIVVASGKGSDGKGSDRREELRRSTAGEGATTTGGGSTAASPQATPADIRRRADQGLLSVSAGDWEGGLNDLKALAAEHPNDPVVLRALALGQSKAKKHPDALSTVNKLVTVSPEAASDKSIEPIFLDALSSPTAVETVFNVLEKMGGDGGRILYDIGYGNKSASVHRSRARKSLAEPEVNKSLTPEIKSAMELRRAPGSCGARKAIIDKYRSDFDERALVVLKEWAPRGGCGFFHNIDCQPCLHDKGYLDGVIAEVEKRMRK